MFLFLCLTREIILILISLVSLMKQNRFAPDLHQCWLWVYQAGNNQSKENTEQHRDDTEIFCCIVTESFNSHVLCVAVLALNFLGHNVDKITETTRTLKLIRSSSPVQLELLAKSSQDNLDSALINLDDSHCPNIMICYYSFHRQKVW